MRRLLGLVFALVAILACVWFMSRRGSAPEVVRAPKREPAIVEANAVTLTAQETPATLDAAAAPDTSVSTTRAPAAIPPPLGAAPPRPDLAEIRGRVLFPGGAPAAGAQLLVRGWTGNQEREMRYGLPKDWKDLDAASDGDGRFSIRFDPPRAFQFVLECNLDGYCEVSWRWGEIEPHAVVDVGDVQLVRGGSIRGRIVDGKGRVLKDDWVVYADSELSDRSKGRDQTRVRDAPDPASGEFVLENLPPGRVHLSAQSRIANWIEGPTVDVQENVETLADITYAGPDNENRISVSVFTRPFWLFEVGDEFEFFLLGAGTEERKATKVPRSSQMFSFEGLAPGVYRVELRDRRFLPWSKDGVAPGTNLDAKLKGNASIVLNVFDEATKERVTHYTLDVRFDRHNGSPNSIRVREKSKESPADLELSGFIPVDQTLIVRADGYGACEVPITDFAPNEQRKLMALMPRASRVAGRVVSGPGRTPLERVKVSLLPKRPQSESGLIMRRDSDPDGQSVETDVNGIFSFENVTPMTYTLRASMNPFFAAERPLSVEKSAVIGDIELVLPARCWLDGRLKSGAGASFADLKAMAVPSERSKPDRNAFDEFLFFRGEDAHVLVDSDGKFSIGPMPPGEVTVSVQLPDVRLSTGRSGWSSTPGKRIELGMAILVANERTQREFDFSLMSPGLLEVHVTIDGVASSGLTVHAEEIETRARAAVIPVDAQGNGKSGPVAPGTYDLKVYAEGSGFSWTSGLRRSLGPNENAKVAIDVRLFPGEFRVVDEKTGAPLADRALTLASDEQFMFGTLELRSDAQGVVRTKLPPGSYRVTAAQGHVVQREESAGIAWTSNGASTAELRLPALPPR